MSDAPRPLTRHQQQLVDASLAIQAELPKQIDFLHTVHCQCGLPYRNPGDEVREWDREQGYAALRIEAGSGFNPNTGKFQKLGLPWGEKPRLVLIHLASEAVRTGSPIVDVSDSMTSFARSLGIPTNGHHLTLLKDQLSRLSVATVRIGLREAGRAVQINAQFVSAMDLWYPTAPEQRVLWPSTVRLSQDYFDSLTKHAVPLDRRAVSAIASSAMALDIYMWLAQRLHRVSPSRPQFIPWTAIHFQFGQGFHRLRDSRRAFLRTLIQVQAVYPSARYTYDYRGLTLIHSPPPVPSRSPHTLIA